MYVSLFHHGEFYYTLLFRSSHAKVQQNIETGSSASSGTRKSFVVNKCYSQMSNKLKIVLNLGIVRIHPFLASFESRILREIL